MTKKSETNYILASEITIKTSQFRFILISTLSFHIGNDIIRLASVITNIIISIIFIIVIPMILIMFVILWPNPSPVWSDAPKFGLQIWFRRTSSHICCSHIFARVTVYLIKIVEVFLLQFGANINTGSWPRQGRQSQDMFVYVPICCH